MKSKTSHYINCLMEGKSKMSREIQLFELSLRLPRWMNGIWVRGLHHLLDIAEPIPQRARLVKNRTESGVECLAPIGKQYLIGINTKSQANFFQDDKGVQIIEWVVLDLETRMWFPMELLDIDQTTPPSIKGVGNA